jgi:hypothetical protein
MKEPTSLFEGMDPVIEAEAIRRAEAAIDAGRGVPHKLAREWLLKLAQGEDSPPPEAA